MLRSAARAGLLALALAATLALGGREARAFVQYRTSKGVGWSWQGTTCMPIAVYAGDFQDMTVNEVTAAATGATAAWSAFQNPCTYLTLSARITLEPTPDVVPRRLAVIVFRAGKWCKVLTDGSCSLKPEDVSVYDESVLMLTSSEVNEKTGGMTRSGIEVNGVQFSWADMELHPERDSPTTQDLQNALTHELGHFIGLDHNCSPTGANPAPVDDLGEPAPDCDRAPASIVEATMFPTAPHGDLQKRTLAADDERAACHVYPIADDPKVCSPPWDRDLGCGCASSPVAGASGLAGLALLIALGGLARRRPSARVTTRLRR
jgi:MYXO-CTERM domain-containing protein